MQRTVHKIRCEDPWEYEFSSSSYRGKAEDKKIRQKRRRRLLEAETRMIAAENEKDSTNPNE